MFSEHLKIIKEKKQRVDLGTLKCDHDLWTSYMVLAHCTLSHGGKHLCKVILYFYN